ncbi:hypothetical protein AB1286_29160 [Trinickia sp. NRRL B-1857]|uniref:hypothetical protein n=1 Tax=Trinickia sp. NRRL B-1857 TaxID=3162879 RepID=UPI003D2C64D2
MSGRSTRVLKSPTIELFVPVDSSRSRCRIARMKSPEIVEPLEHPLAEFSSTAGCAREVVVAGLRWPTAYWCSLAVDWLEQGLPVDDDIVELLEAIAKNRGFPQNLRHRALSIYKRSTK